MTTIYSTKSITKGNEIKLCKYLHDPKYDYVITINGFIRCYATNIRDAYILYNEYAS